MHWLADTVTLWRSDVLIFCTDILYWHTEGLTYLLCGTDSLILWHSDTMTLMYFTDTLTHWGTDSLTESIDSLIHWLANSLIDSSRTGWLTDGQSGKQMKEQTDWVTVWWIHWHILTNWLVNYNIVPVHVIAKQHLSCQLIVTDRQIIDQFRYNKIQPNIVDLSSRFWGINPTNSVVTPQSLVLRSVVLRWFLIYRNWSIYIVLLN